MGWWFYGDNFCLFWDVKHENTMWAKCKSYVVDYIVIHIRVQYMSAIYCGSNYEVNSSLIYVNEILYFARDQQSSHTTVSYFLKVWSIAWLFSMVSTRQYHVRCFTALDRFRRACYWLVSQQTVVMWWAYVGWRVKYCRHCFDDWNTQVLIHCRVECVMIWSFTVWLIYIFGYETVTSKAKVHDNAWCLCATTLSKHRGWEKSRPQFAGCSTTRKYKLIIWNMRTRFKYYLCLLFISLSVSKSCTLSVVERPAITPVILGKINTKVEKGRAFSRSQSAVKATCG
jgi:hypothetical protein